MMVMQVNRNVLLKRARREAGQTLVIAVIILGVLLILGIAFSSIINRNISETRDAGRRTVAGDAARAGIENAHDEMLNSPFGADWRPAPTPPVSAGNFSKDPDALYLRPGSGIAVEPDPVNHPGVTVVDLGGPDYQGPYSRINFSASRALVRVRYQPNDYAASVASNGSLRRPSLIKNKMVIESVGRRGVITGNDPTQQLGVAVQVAGYLNAAELAQRLGEMKDADKSVRDTKKTLAVVDLATEYSLFVMNNDKTTRPMNIGVPSSQTAVTTWMDTVGLGVTYESTNISVPTVIGQNPGTVTRASNPWENLPGMGSVHVNGSVLLNGRVDLSLNQNFGESLEATDGITYGNDATTMNLALYTFNNPLDQWEQYAAPFNVPGNLLASNNPNFSTFNGAIKDGASTQDNDLEAGLTASNPDFYGGFMREVKRIEPPLISRLSPGAGTNRYRELTESSGSLTVNGVAKGPMGYGDGVYVNTPERANRLSESTTALSDPSKSLPNDWLNPDNANSLGWQGPYYVPVATYVQLLPDGFVLTRDSRSKKRFWQSPVDGTSLNQASMRFYVRQLPYTSVTGVVTMQPAILSEAEANAAGINGATATGPQFASAAHKFNGVIMVDGDARVRGVIPTDTAMTLVSMGSIYIEGSITKGVTSSGGTLTNPSKSMIALMAHDFVVLNTTQFFGPATSGVQAKSGDSLPDTPNPVELGATNTDLTLTAQFLLDRNGRNPQLWQPLATRYTMPAGLGTTTSRDLPVNMLLQVSADDNGPSFVTAQANALTSFNTNLNTGSVLFPTYKTYGFGGTTSVDPFNAAAPYYTPSGTPQNDLIPHYGLGDPAINAYPKFETIAMPIVNPQAGGYPGYASSYSAAARQIQNLYATTGSSNLLAVEDPTEVTLSWNNSLNAQSKNFLAARTALAPYDVRIEAVCYAERGSFFVIPGAWFNSNPDDNRASFEQSYTPGVAGDDLNTARLDYGGGANLLQAQQRRYQRYGNSPEVPFYGEPLDVKVTIVGSVIENTTAPVSQQAEWLKKWGWIPRRLGGTGLTIPVQHTGNYNLNTDLVVPNLQIVYDPSLATGAVPIGPALSPIRVDTEGRMLPPLPRMPVSPTLSYFGEATS